MADVDELLKHSEMTDYNTDVFDWDNDWWRIIAVFDYSEHARGFGKKYYCFCNRVTVVGPMVITRRVLQKSRYCVYLNNSKRGLA